MARNYNLKPTSPSFARARRCEILSRRSRYRGRVTDIPIGTVCQRTDGSWGYNHVGAGGPNTLYGRGKTKAAAIKGAIKAYKGWVGGGYT